MEIGIDSFAAVMPHSQTRAVLAPAQRLAGHPADQLLMGVHALRSRPSCDKPHVPPPPLIVCARAMALPRRECHG
jgi:hypothetical protein